MILFIFDICFNPDYPLKIREGSMSPNDRLIGKMIKETVFSVCADARVYLYGSRARGDETVDSDWDIIVISQKGVTPQIKKTIRHALYNVEWENGCVISSIIHDLEDWESPRMKLTPFYRNVKMDAIQL
jgi:uncharacterized protein